MILSNVDLTSYEMRQLGINDEYGIHKLVYSMFPNSEDMQRDFLYLKRCGFRRNVNILVLSKRNPTIPDYCKISCKKIPDDYFDHSEYNFMVKVNPVKRSSESTKLVPLIEYDEMIKWFCGKAEKSGMKVDPNRLDIQDKGVDRVSKGARELIFNKATFVGNCTIVDKEAFIETFQKGFGRGKAFGFGLMQIRPVSVF